MNGITNLDLLSVAVTIAGIGVIGFTIFLNNRKSVTNKAFLLFTVVSIFWGIANYLNYKFDSQLLVLWILRSEIFFGVWQAFSLFLLISVFPQEKIAFSKKIRYFILPLTILTSILTLTPLVFVSISQFNNGGESVVNKGPGILLFLITVLILFISAFYVLIKKYRASRDLERKQLQFFSIGLLITFSLIAAFNFLLPALFNDLQLAPWGALFILPFIIFTGYTIYRHKLFNIKVATTAVLVFILSVVTFLEIVFSNTASLIVFRSSEFILVLAIGINLIRSVLKEVEQREKIEVQEKELEVANKGQEDLIHIINHQIKGYLTKSRIIFSELLTEPDYGPVSDKAKPMMETGLKSLTEGVDFVQGVLNASNIETGTFTYTMQSVDLKSLVMEAADKQRENAIKKGLTYDVVIADGNYLTTGDPIQLKEAFRNLIDNSIHYTPEGGIHVSLSRQHAGQNQNATQSSAPQADKQGDKFVFAVIDTGVGLSDELKPKLFTKGGRGKDSLKINVNSTGYGLSFVKGVIEAHKGRVWAESGGPGKGSQFYVELPAKV